MKYIPLVQSPLGDHEENQVEILLSCESKSIGLTQSFFTPSTLVKWAFSSFFSSSFDWDVLKGNVPLLTSQVCISTWLAKQNRQNVSVLNYSWKPASECAPRVSAETESIVPPTVYLCLLINNRSDSKSLRSFNSGSRTLAYPHVLTWSLLHNMAR